MAGGIKCTMKPVARGLIGILSIVAVGFYRLDLGLPKIVVSFFLDCLLTCTIILMFVSFFSLYCGLVRYLCGLVRYLC